MRLGEQQGQPGGANESGIASQRGPGYDGLLSPRKAFCGFASAKDDGALSEFTKHCRRKKFPGAGDAAANHIQGKIQGIYQALEHDP